MRPFIRLCLLAFPCLDCNLTSRAEEAARRNGELVFSVRTWKGEYYSKDIPGDVEVTPVAESIWKIHADGTGLKEIVRPGKSAEGPKYGPDAKWIYYQSNVSGQPHLYRCKPDGSGVVQLTSAEKLGKPWVRAFALSMSSDGRRLAFAVFGGSTARIAVTDPEVKQLHLTSDKLGYLYMSAISPAGDRVVCCGPGSGYRLLGMNMADGQVSNLTPQHPDSYLPQFTPDGRTVVFIRRDGDIYRVDVDGANLKRLTNGNQYVEFRLSKNDQHGSSDGPHVSPDGKRIAYIAVKDGVPNVCAMDIDGKRQKQITFRKAACGRVRWSPDGKQIAFVSFTGKYPQLFVIPADGGEPRQLTNLDGAVYYLNWKPLPAR